METLLHLKIYYRKVLIFCRNIYPCYHWLSYADECDDHIQTTVVNVTQPMAVTWLWIFAVYPLQVLERIFLKKNSGEKWVPEVKVLVGDFR